MANVEGAYSGTADLLIGDIGLQPQHGDGTKMIKAQADDIDAQLGHIYVTPIVVPSEPEFRPTMLLLKKINNLLASGRLMLDMSAAGEEDRVNAYGMSMLREGLGLLGQIQAGSIVLAGAPRIDQGVAAPGPTIHNEDSVSLVEQFYNPTLRQSLSPYGTSGLPYSGSN